jgi:hypothetical protein
MRRAIQQYVDPSVQLARCSNPGLPLILLVLCFVAAAVTLATGSVEDRRRRRQWCVGISLLFVFLRDDPYYNRGNGASCRRAVGGPPYPARTPTRETKPFSHQRDQVIHREDPVVPRQLLTKLHLSSLPISSPHLWYDFRKWRVHAT